MAPERSGSDSATTLADAEQAARAGDLEMALRAAQEYLDKNPNNAAVWRFLGHLNHARQRTEEAIACVKRATLLAPERADLLLEYGLYLVADGRRGKALRVASRLESMKLGTPGLDAGLGTLLSYCDEPHRALAWFEAALRQVPHDTGLLFNRASAQMMTGDVSGAEQSLDRLLAANPTHGRAQLLRSGLRIQTSSHNHVAELRQALGSREGDVDNAIALLFALGKELEDIGDFENAFNVISAGCHRQRRRMQYDVSQDIAAIDRIIAVHTRAVVTDAEGFETEEPIFVLGLPRSGTTLVAQILASHSSVVSLGETPAFAAEMVAAVRRRLGRTPGKLELVSEVLQLSPRHLGAVYLEATRPQSGMTTRFVDKTPLNYLYAGLIARSLPAAKMVAVARDPMDVCFSMFKTLFTGAYPFSYDLGELGLYFVAWHRLMEHWMDVLGERLLIVQYEDLVKNQEAVTRRLLTHCGLAWEDSCLRFNDLKNSVTTASAVQVRRSLYTSSVGAAASRYGRWLETLKNELAGHHLVGARLAVT